MRHAARLLAPRASPRRAGVPLQVGTRVLGALAVGTHERHAYSEEELALLQSLADQAAIAIDNARLFFEEQTRRAYLNALLEINTKIGALAPTTTLLTVHRRGGGAAARASTTPASACWRATSSSWPASRARPPDDGPPAPQVGESLSGRVVSRAAACSLDLAPSPARAGAPRADPRLGYTSFSASRSWPTARSAC